VNGYRYLEEPDTLSNSESKHHIQISDKHSSKKINIVIYDAIGLNQTRIMGNYQLLHSMITSIISLIHDVYVHFYKLKLGACEVYINIILDG